MTEARAGVCDLVVGDEEKKAKIVTGNGSGSLSSNVVPLLNSLTGFTTSKRIYIGKWWEISQTSDMDLATNSSTGPVTRNWLVTSLSWEAGGGTVRRVAFLRVASLDALHFPCVVGVAV